jgi:predicted RNase H-like HicB family nuclease
LRFTQFDKNLINDIINLTNNFMRKINFKSVVWKEGNFYISQCLEVDVSSFGKTKKEALAMLEDALALYFEDEPLPKEIKVKRPAIASVSVSYA